MGSTFTPDTAEAGVARLVDAGTLTAEQAEAVRSELGIDAPDRDPAAARAATGTTARAASGTAGASSGGRRSQQWTALVAELGGYVGGAFVLAAAAVLLEDRWEQLSRTGTVLLLAVPALLVLAAAGAVALSGAGRWTPDPGPEGSGPRRRLVSVLVTLGAGLGAAAAAEATGPSYSGVAAALTALTVSALGYLACRAVLLHLSAAFWALMSVYAAFDHLSGSTWEYAGLAVAVLALAWGSLALAGLLAERVLGLVVATGLAFVGGESLTLASADGAAPLGYVVLTLVAAAGIGGYIALHHVPLLVAGTVTLAVLVPQFVLDNAGDSLGAAGGLLVSGLSIVGASVLAMRVRAVA